MITPCILGLATPDDLNELLPLIQGYQAFYEITNVDQAQTRRFFGAVIATPSEGFIMVARSEGRMIGFASAYITLSGYLAQRVVHLGDLFVHPDERHRGTGRALIQGVSNHAQTLGINITRWLTSPTNTTAHRLYDSLGAVPSDLRLYLLHHRGETAG